MRPVESIICVVSVAIGLMFSCVVVQAGPLSMPESPILLGGSNPVKFDHVVHRDLEISCGECHHNREHDPRPASEILSFSGGNVLRCRNCHNKHFVNPNLQTKKDIFHTNCRICHLVGFNGHRPPPTCKSCHLEQTGMANY